MHRFYHTFVFVSLEMKLTLSLTFASKGQSHCFSLHPINQKRMTIKYTNIPFYIKKTSMIKTHK